MAYQRRTHDETRIQDIDFQSGDLLLFTGQYKAKTCCHRSFICFMDACIRCCTQSKFVHSAVVIRDPTFTARPLKGVYLLESTGLEPVEDVEDGQLKLGVQLRELHEVLGHYGGDVFYRKLNEERNLEFYQKLAQIHSTVHNCPYDERPSTFLKLIVNNTHNDQSKKKFICSALCAYVYTQLGLLPSDTPWSIVRPKDLSYFSKDPKRVFLNFQFRPEVKIVY